MDSMKRAEDLKNILERLHRGDELSDVKKEFREKFGTASAAEIAQAENRLISEGLPPEEIKNLCDIHADLFTGSIKHDNDGNSAGSDEGHPLSVFREDNRELSGYINERLMPAAVNYFGDKSDKNRESLLEVLRVLYKNLDIHYSVKENLIFPYLEKGGVTAPPKVMWGVDDEIRQMIKNLSEKLTEGTLEKEDLGQTVEKIKSMITKETEILTPLLLHHLKEEDWVTVGSQIPEIGFSFSEGTEGTSPSDVRNWVRRNSMNLNGIPLIEKKEKDTHGEGEIILPSGKINIKQLERMLNTLPSDITFVGADGRVAYFSEAKERVFPRTRTIIGRKVEDCHPPKSLSAVESLIEDFKSGKKDSENFWIQRGGKFILIRYYAVRSDEGEYMGVLEVTEDISGIKNLEGNKTLAD